MTLALALNDTLENQSQLNLSDAIEATVFDGTSVSSFSYLNQHNQCNYYFTNSGQCEILF